METRRITLILHHRGSFVREMGEVKYVGGEFCIWEGLDVDTVNLFTVETLCKDHYYRRFEKILWLKPGRDLGVGLRELVKDKHVMEMCNAGMENNGEVEIFFIHPVDLPFIVVDENEDSVEQPQKPTDVTDQTTMHAPAHSPFDDYESAEDSVYRPSPHVSDADESIDHVPLSRKRGASSAEKGKGVFVFARRKKGKKVGGSGEGVSVPALSEEEEIHDDEQQPEEDEFFFGDDEQPEEDEVFLGGSIGHRQTYTYGYRTENVGGPQLDELCGHSNHYIRKCTNIGVPQKPKNWVDPAPAEPQAANNDPQAGPEEVVLSQGVPSDDVPNSQPNMSQRTNVDSNLSDLTPTTQPPIVATSANSVQPSMPQSQAVGYAVIRPPSRGRYPRNPPYKAPTTVQGGFRKKLNTVRPTNLTHSAPHNPGHNNTAAPQTQLQPSNETMLAASLGTGERFMQFIPTPPGPSTAGPRPRGPPSAGKPK
ncbi:hypothetical protein SESBI_41188 [Sesbania bispinosa]|nr:hypothetical protein SESBI_41188 [Sesbania bispinosa]